MRIYCLFLIILDLNRSSNSQPHLSAASLPMSASQNTNSVGAHVVFNFGSNSTAQLRARLGNPKLSTHRAIVNGWSRIFHKYVPAWAGSSASIARSEGGAVHGTVTKLSNEEKAKLDFFEMGCDEVTVSAKVYNADGNGETQTIDAVAYVIRVPEGHQGISQPYPSEQYLCAVAGMLREHWPVEITSPIGICAVRDGRVVSRGEWTHPYTLGRNVESLQALAIEINLRLKKPWIMPRGALAFEAAIVRQFDMRYAEEVMKIFVREGGGIVAAKLDGDDGVDFEIDEEDLSQALEQVLKAPAQNV